MANLVQDIELSKFFRVSTRAIRSWVNDLGMPKVGPNQYDFVQCADWRIKFLEIKIEELESGTETEKKIRMDYLKSKAEREKIEVAKIKGELIPIVDVNLILEKIFTSVKIRILSWSKNIPKMVFNKNLKEVEAIIETETNKILNELSTNL